MHQTHDTVLISCDVYSNDNCYFLYQFDSGEANGHNVMQVTFIGLIYDDDFQYKVLTPVASVI